MRNLAGMEWWQVIWFGFLFRSGWWLSAALIELLRVRLPRKSATP